MRQEVENPIVREPAERLSISTQEKLAEYQRPAFNMDRFREMWKDTTRRMEDTK